jgi:hypothetical protein
LDAQGSCRSGCFSVISPSCCCWHAKLSPWTIIPSQAAVCTLRHGFDGTMFRRSDWQSFRPGRVDGARCEFAGREVEMRSPTRVARELVGSVKGCCQNVRIDCAVATGWEGKFEDASKWTLRNQDRKCTTRSPSPGLVPRRAPATSKGCSSINQRACSGGALRRSRRGQTQRGSQAERGGVPTLQGRSVLSTWQLIRLPAC